MSAEELFAYTLGAIGLAYVIGFSAMAYFAIKFDLPMFGAPPPKDTPIPPWATAYAIRTPPTGEEQ